MARVPRASLPRPLSDVMHAESLTFSPACCSLLIDHDNAPAIPQRATIMKIAIACDHGGFPAKKTVVDVVTQLGHEVVDLGAYQNDPKDDYPDFARYVGQAIQHKQADRGILVCGSGVGACVAANKIKGVRACVCHDTYSAAQGVEHDDMNVLCLGGRIVGEEMVKALVKAYVTAKFSGEERHQRRLDKVLAIEAAL